MDIYEVLDKIFNKKESEVADYLFKEEDKISLSDQDRLVFDILKNISSFGTNISNSGISFCPKFVGADGYRTFSIEDITDLDYKILRSIDFHKLPLALRALVADVLWTQKEEINAAQIAAEAYWELFQLYYAEDDYRTLNAIRRAVCISLQTKQSSLWLSINKWISNFLKNDAVNADNSFSLRIMEVFAEQKKYDVAPFLPILDCIISSDNDNILKIEKAYQLKTSCLNKLGQKEDARNNNISLADFYFDFAEKIMQKDTHNAIRAERYYNDAITLCRNNGEPERAKQMHKRLLEIQKEIPKNMAVFSWKHDISGLVEYIKENMEGLTLEECVIKLAIMIPFFQQEEVKKEIIEEIRTPHLFQMFGKNIKNAQGQTIFTLRTLDIQNPEKDQKLLEQHMHQRLLQKQQDIGDLFIMNALAYIRERFIVDNSMIEFLVKDNPIIPEGRERIFQSAIGMFLRGEFYEAIHILAPQIENLFRNIAKECNALTVTLEEDGSSKEKTLSSIFDFPELLDCYDNDILFTFKGLLNEQAGANIRNQIAHGIIEDATCSSGCCLYFGVAVIKLLSLTSVYLSDVITNYEKLKEIKPLPKDAVKVIKED